MEQLLALPEPPDAVVVANNLMGIGALQVLRAAELSPEQFGVAVFGDLPFSPLGPSGVTVIQLPARQLGFTAAELLMERIAGDDQPARTVILQND
jgi:LacI family transcriptional regulator